ncbi:hypothetical protein [Shewanella sp. SR44-3]|uniref:hypothetical protein n=1 Tax=unclassified Shewanella TaxID=196818 RepID=UPI0015F798DA|nr:hypothetical protein [Shewanella sp. SR44-3]MBB1268957.1 hypothetical protein [Shewanella sp. SR44-3]
MNTLSSSSSTFIRACKTTAFALSIGLTAALSAFSANADLASAQVTSAPVSAMERIAVGNRSPFEYALYLRTNEMLANFHTQLEQKNLQYVRSQNQAMAKKFSRFTASSATLSVSNKHLDKKRVLQAAQ